MLQPDGRGNLRLFSGNANSGLAGAIARYFETTLSAATIGSFRDGETRVVVQDDVHGADVFAIQPTSPPVNEHLMELLLLLDALRRAGADRCTAVIPYYGYARQERRTTPQEPISAKLVANLLTAAGADHIVTMDLSAEAIEGFFDLPVDHLHAIPLLARAFQGVDPRQTAIVAPDVGAVKRAEAFQRLVAPGAPIAVVLKDRPRPDEVGPSALAGDVRGKHVILVDDMISTGGTLLHAASLALESGAISVSACAVHGVFAPGAIDALLASLIQRVVVTNPIPVEPRERLEVVNVASLFAEAIDRIHGARVTEAELMAGPPVI